MLVPFSNKPKITVEDVNTGFVNRYFVKQLSSKKITEIDKVQYDKFVRNPYYTAITVPWAIAGYDKDILDNSGNLILGAANRNLQIIKYYEEKMSGLGNILKNPLEYFNGTLVTPRNKAPEVVVLLPPPPRPVEYTIIKDEVVDGISISNNPTPTPTPTLTPTLTPTPTPTVTPSTPAIPYVTDNLLIHLDAGNPSSYPGSGTVWTDLSGNGYNGTLNNGITYSGADGGTLVLDGYDDYVSISSLDLRRNFSLELWVKINAYSPALQALFGQGVPAGSQGLHIFIGSDNTINYRMYGNDYNLLSTVNTGQWYQFVFTYSNSSPYQKKIYKNGTLLGASSGGQAQWLGTGPFRIGHTYSYINPSEKLNGPVGIFRVYSKVLSDAEVLQNYNYNKARFGL